MIHVAAIILGALVIMAIAGFFYVIHTVLAHFGLDTEDVVVGVLSIAVTLALAWLFGNIVLELIGIL